MGLYDEFKCYGHFYKITKNGVVITSCRSQLDIIDSNMMMQDDLSNSTPDALAIMMNPGTSKPMSDTYQEQKIDLINFTIMITENDLVTTVPDDTQKRLMKIMQFKKWKHIRVINLSDIRQHESEKLASEINNYKLHSLNHEHSLFSEVRRIELIERLDQVHGKPIILAWGTRTCLKPYMVECKKKLVSSEYYGVMAAKEGYYHHPLTTKIKWVESLMKLFDAGYKGVTNYER